MKGKWMQYNKMVIASSLVAAALMAATGEARAALAIDFTSAVAAEGWVENGGPGTFVPGANGYTIVGWSFMPTTDLNLTRLGVYDADRDRVHSEQHHVGIWSLGDEPALLASVSIDESTMNEPETSPHGAKFHFENTASPVRLTAGQTYVVGATLFAGQVTAGQVNGQGADDFDSFAAFNNGDSPIYISPYLTYLGNAYAINNQNTLILPTSTFVTDYTIGANFDASPVPVPAAVWLLGSGLLGVAGLRRKQQ